MDKLGKVEKIQNNMAEIKIIRDSACGDNCAACGLCPNREMMVVLPTIPGLFEGDSVQLSSDTSQVVKKTVFGYMLLTLLLILGGILGTLWGSEWLGFFLAIATLVIGVLIIRRLAPKGVEIHIEKLAD